MEEPFKKEDPVKILVVDDEVSLQSIILQLFKLPIKNREMEFSFAVNGMEALEKLKKDSHIDIILTDINMPIMDGLTLLSNIGDLKQLYRAVVISAYGDLANIRSAMNRGACDFIPKPIDLKDLEDTIKRTILQHRNMKLAALAQGQVIEYHKELEIASGIQRSLIPSNFKPFINQDNFVIYGEMIPAKEVGGDLFDFFPLDDHRLGFVVADVSGKGVPAALFMTMTRALICGFAFKTETASECIALTNLALCNKNDASVFVTAFYGVLDVKTGELNYCNAGHNPPLIISKDGTLKEIGRQEGLPLGITASLEESKELYQDKKVALKDEDILFLYTDGVTEAQNSKRELFQEERLKKFLSASAHLPVEKLVKELNKAIKAFEGDAKQSDDITILAMQVGLSKK